MLSLVDRQYLYKKSYLDEIVKHPYVNIECFISTAPAPVKQL